MSAPSARYLPYPSRLDLALRLFGLFMPAPAPAPAILRLHGWHGAVKHAHPDNVELSGIGVYHEIYPEMRGRGDSSGRPDANGYELQDAVDALAAGPEHLGAGYDPRGVPLLWGGSGGGGNVLGLVGKFPDLFAAAVAECAISDYALWFAHDQVGEFRDEMETAGWIGGTPTARPEAYLARGGRATALNLRTPLLIVHGEADPRVPFEQATAYLDAARDHDTEGLVQGLSFPGVGHPGHWGGLDAAGQEQRRDRIARHLAAHRNVPPLPDSGRLAVAGFVQTRRFRVDLGSADRVALLEYDLPRGRFALRAPSARVASVTVPGEGAARQIPCAPISLDDLCADLRIPNPATYELLPLRASG